MDPAVSLCSTVMGARELKLKHQVSIPMSLYEGDSFCVTPWFSSPEFIAKRLLLRCYFTAWNYDQNGSRTTRNYVIVQIVGGDVLPMLHKVTDISEMFSQFRTLCAKGRLEVQFSAPDTAADTSTGSFAIIPDYLCTPQARDIPIPFAIEHKAVSKWAEKGKNLLLTIRVTLLVPEDPISLPACPAQLSASATLQRMLSEGLHSDVQLQLQGGVLHAHRAVLAACSPVFRAMFQHDMKESQSGQVDMPDVPLAAMEASLRFLYGGELSSPDLELWMQLLELADRFQLAPLKALCEATLCARVPGLSAELLLRLLVLGVQHSAPGLRTATLSRLTTCMRDRRLEIDVRDLVKSHPDVAEEVIKSFLS